MTNEHLIRSAHVWALAILLAFGVMAFAVSGESGQTQNSNSSQTQNSNRNANSNSSSSSNATGERTAAAAVNADDRKFMMEAATGGMMEVELGRLAAQHDRPGRGGLPPDAIRGPRVRCRHRPAESASR